MKILLLLAYAALGSSVAIDECKFHDYRPCLCLGSGKFGLEIFCSVGEESDIPLIRKAFRQSKVKDHASVALEISYFSAIPADLLGGKSSRQLHLYGPQQHQFSPNQLNADVFASSANKTRELFIYDSDLSVTDWSFLERLQQLEQLFIRMSILESFQTLPHLPQLHTVYLEDCQGKWAWPAGATPNLQTLTIKSATDFNQVDLEDVLQSLPSTVTSLEVSDSKLIRIPAVVGRLHRLKYLDLSHNAIRTLPAGRLPVMFQPYEVNISHNGLQVIYGGAFKGNFSGTSLDLSHNKLTRFDASIFLPVLQSMAGSKGFIYLYQNPIRCDCDIAWLIVDHRPLLEHIWNGACSSGIAFQQLQESSFTHCPSNRIENEA